MSEHDDGSSILRGPSDEGISVSLFGSGSGQRPRSAALRRVEFEVPDPADPEKSYVYKVDVSDVRANDDSGHNWTIQGIATLEQEIHDRDDKTERPRLVKISFDTRTGEGRFVLNS